MVVSTLSLDSGRFLVMPMASADLRTGRVCYGRVRRLCLFSWWWCTGSSCLMQPPSLLGAAANVCRSGDTGWAEPKRRSLHLCAKSGNLTEHSWERREPTLLVKGRDQFPPLLVPPRLAAHIKDQGEPKKSQCWL